MMETRPLYLCYQAHQELVRRAGALLQRIGRTDDADLMRLAASCIDLAARRALATRDDAEAIRSWRECALGEQQIRAATYWAMRRGRLHAREYDETFGAAASATRAREAEIDRLKRRMARSCFV
jgi:hypothetical protein